MHGGLKYRPFGSKEMTKIPSIFINMKIIKKNVNSIWKMRDKDGVEATSFEDLARIGKDHFERIYKDDNKVNIVDIIHMTYFFLSFVLEEDNGILMEEVSKAELKDVLHRFQKDKSPSPDGWLVEFFLGFYEIIGDDLLRVIEESRTSGRVLATFNSTFIALIPKSNNP
jgi:hypothetical protein